MNLKVVSFAWLLVTLCGLALIGYSYRGQDGPPESLESLKSKQAHIYDVVQSAMPATVAVSDGIGSGSGVIVSEEGLVLTAAHVLMTGGESFEITFPDGRQVTATPLGRNLDVDAGMLKINEPGPWPFVPMGDLKDLQPGDWCVGMGYPGGYQLGRTPPVRVGRILASAATVIMTDSALIGGDSGGPLFNLNGEVIGIHSSIGASIDQNRHVPVALFERDWERLVRGEAWGRLGSQVELNPNRPMLGIQMEQLENRTMISGIIANSPAETAGLQVGDLIMRIDGQEVTRPIDVIALVSRKRVGDTITMDVLREEKALSYRVKLTRKSELNLPQNGE